MSCSQHMVGAGDGLMDLGLVFSNDGVAPVSLGEEGRGRSEFSLLDLLFMRPESRKQYKQRCEVGEQSRSFEQLLAANSRN